MQHSMLKCPALELDKQGRVKHKMREIKRQEQMMLAKGKTRACHNCSSALKTRGLNKQESPLGGWEVVVKASWLGCFPPSNPCRFSEGGRTSSKSRHRGWVSYLPAYLPAVPHVRHQWLVWRFGRLGDGDTWGVLWKEGGQRKGEKCEWENGHYVDERGKNTLEINHKTSADNVLMIVRIM